MARPTRFERVTAWFVARYSIQLSYGRNYSYKELGRGIIPELISYTSKEKPAFPRHSKLKKGAVRLLFM